ncbi:AAA family ATPase [Synechococcus elongatus IITB4]|uniref:bifunctional aminoglycoside phosphotransferase/ATP-binding protein n=1 Tax=Synechococcus elongatus TaxID=32046 RepID=UPI0030D564FB
MTDAALPLLIQQMLQPEFYPHAVETPVQLYQTHCSYVLLTGPYAYKLKKPVNFGFLDYSTLEKRQHFLQEELRLNQRTAAPLYQQVLAISKTGDRYQFSEGEPAEEYALQMKQFPKGCLFSEQFEAGHLDAGVMRQLAGVVADFHARTWVDDHVRSYGQVAQIRKAFDENYQQTLSYVGGPQTQTQFEETKAFSDRFFDTQSALFTARTAADKIRECHGDLHLGNLCRWDDQLFLFDCIEFNEPFRFVDTMYDIAFLVMDLDARGRKDLGTAFLNAYAEMSGDWEGLQVLPLYLSRQAYVRAKVTSFLLDDPAIDSDRRQQAFDQAAAYYRLAHAYAQPAQQGELLLLSGLSGSGKSTLGRTIVERQRAIILRSDAVRKHLAGVPLFERGGPELYSAEMNDRTYNRLLQLGLCLARAGYRVILDAKYDRQAYRNAAIAAAQSQEIPIRILHCQASESTLRQRLQDRQGDIADATADLVSQQLAAWQGFNTTEQNFVQTIATEEPLAEQLDAIGL